MEGEEGRHYGGGPVVQEGVGEGGLQLSRRSVAALGGARRKHIVIERRSPAQEVAIQRIVEGKVRVEEEGEEEGEREDREGGEGGGGRAGVCEGLEVVVVGVRVQFR